MKIFENTQEFEKIQKSSEISFSEANIIFQKYHNEKEFKDLKPIFYYFENGYYYFGYETDPTNDKQNKIWYFLELKINAKTGEYTSIDEQVDDWKTTK
ncbi:hypothetical protein M9991_14970 [Chryseobacterium gallinarum]|uniref:hypothetical protein n=1 Tax=Chryseobacterium gallinarum TaxID=1324352 RepID=UPI002025385F|nr:hypothetical protein [Chryseobacterium gallinarum]MCL8538170.1 hypothetical protein [Chryseobacterium gallinarum]